jgi:hypothetical protein
MHLNSKQLQQQQADLATAHAESCKLQQENVSLRKQHALKLLTTDIPLSSSGHTTSPTVSSLPHNPPTLSKRPSSPKVAKPKCNTSQPSLAMAARQFSSPAEPTGFKHIHVPVRFPLPLQQLLSNLCRLHINAHRTLDIHYSNRNLDSFLIHIFYETELRSPLSKFNITVCEDFDFLDASTIHNLIPVNELTGRKVQRARKVFLHRICISLQRFRAPIHNAAAHFFVQSGLIDIESLASYNLTLP